MFAGYNLSLLISRLEAVFHLSVYKRLRDVIVFRKCEEKKQNKNEMKQTSSLSAHKNYKMLTFY